MKSGECRAMHKLDIFLLQFWIIASLSNFHNEWMCSKQSVGVIIKAENRKCKWLRRSQRLTEPLFKLGCVEMAFHLKGLIETDQWDKSQSCIRRLCLSLSACPGPGPHQTPNTTRLWSWSTLATVELAPSDAPPAVEEDAWLSMELHPSVESVPLLSPGLWRAAPCQRLDPVGLCPGEVTAELGGTFPGFVDHVWLSDTQNLTLNKSKSLKEICDMSNPSNSSGLAAYSYKTPKRAKITACVVLRPLMNAITRTQEPDRKDQAPELLSKWIWIF